MDCVLFDVTDNSLITHKRRCAVVGHFKNDVKLLAHFVGDDKFCQWGPCVRDGDFGFCRVRFLVLPPAKAKHVVVGIGCPFGVQ